MANKTEKTFTQTTVTLSATELLNFLGVRSSVDGPFELRVAQGGKVSFDRNAQLTVESALDEQIPSAGGS